MPSLLTAKAEKPFSLAPSPHLKAAHSVSRILWGTLAALLPIGASSLLLFGWDALRIFSIAVVSAVGFEYLFQTLSREKIQIRNGSTALVAALFTFLLAPTTPSWVIATGSFVAVVIGKEIFGGLGQNLFHPALAGYLTLAALFPLEMNQSVGMFPTNVNIGPLFFGIQSSSLIGASSFAVLVSGSILLVKKWIPWESPLFYLAAVGVGSFVIKRYPAYEILNSSIFLCAFFFVTDWVTTPVTRLGRICFATAAGILTTVFRFWVPPPQAMASSILLMNAAVPLFDRFIRPGSRGLR